MNSLKAVSTARTVIAPFLYPSFASPQTSFSLAGSSRSYSSTASTSHSVSYAYSHSSSSTASSSSLVSDFISTASTSPKKPVSPKMRTYSTAPNPLHIPVIRTLAQLRRWRREARAKGLSVGVVPTMGALHQGHLDLVRASMARNPLTVMTLFVNPMQFAPHEDLSAYPRQFERDLAQLQTLLTPLPPPASLRGLGISEHDSFRPSRNFTAASSSPSSSASDVNGENPIINGGESQLVVFAPTSDVMYPLKGELQDLTAHKGVSVDVRGWGDVMEGASRPQFFKGVATVCTKLFNAVEPDHAYFGQKDIQQALLLKIMVQDLLLSHPTPENLHILPTTRAASGLALSSRNAYLSPAELRVAPVLYRALFAAQEILQSGDSDSLQAEDLISEATKVILEKQEEILNDKEEVEINLDYIEVFDKSTFAPLRGQVTGKEMVIAGALWVGKTRLIDNLLLGWEVDK